MSKLKYKAKKSSPIGQESTNTPRARSAFINHRGYRNISNVLSYRRSRSEARNCRSSGTIIVNNSIER